MNAYLKSVLCVCARRAESGASLAAKRFEHQRQQELQQQVPLRQFDDCGCYATKMMTMATTIPTYDCPCSVPDSSSADNVVRQIPPPPPPLLLPVGGGGDTATCQVCGRALSAAYSVDESRCRCAGVWKSPYSRLPVAGTGTGSRAFNASTTATGSRRHVSSPRPSDVTTPPNELRHVTMTSAPGHQTVTSHRMHIMTSALGDVGCTSTYRGHEDTTSRRVASESATA